MYNNIPKENTGRVFEPQTILNYLRLPSVLAKNGLHTNRVNLEGMNCTVTQNVSE